MLANEVKVSQCAVPTSIRGRFAMPAGDATNAAELLANCPGINWQVEPRPVYSEDNQYNMTQVIGKRAICRTDTGQALGIVGDKYQPIQTVDALTALDPYTEHPDGPKWHRVWQIDGGAQIWAEARTSWTKPVVKGDLVGLSVLARLSHDGSKSLGFEFQIVRLVCDNGLALPTLAESVKIRHTSGYRPKLSDVAETLAAAHRQFDESVQLYTRMAQVEPTREQVDEVLRRLIPDTKSNRAELQRNRIEDLARNGIGSDLLEHRLTAWSLYNGITELADHHSNASSDDDDMRLSSVLYGRNSELKTDGLNILRQVLAIA